MQPEWKYEGLESGCWAVVQKGRYRDMVVFLVLLWWWRGLTAGRGIALWKVMVGEVTEVLKLAIVGVGTEVHFPGRHKRCVAVCERVWKY